jgi:hypothetical protein
MRLNATKLMCCSFFFFLYILCCHLYFRCTCNDVVNHVNITKALLKQTR